MSTPRPNQQVYIGGFNPVFECVINGGVLIATFFLSFLYTAIVQEGEDLIMWSSIFIGLTTLWRGYMWYGKWQDREFRIQQIQADGINNLTDDQMAPVKRQRALENIWNRGSTVWFSYIYFAIPYGLLVWFSYTIISGYN